MYANCIQVPLEARRGSQIPVGLVLEVAVNHSVWVLGIQHEPVEKQGLWDSPPQSDSFEQEIMLGQ